MNTTTGSTAAILVLERGALWPGPILDWTPHVSVVSQAPGGTAEHLVRRARRAAGRCISQVRSVGCVLVSFADAPSAPIQKFREELVQGLGALAPEIGCRRLVLAAYHVHYLDFTDLLALARTTPFSSSERVEICFHPARNHRTHGARASLDER